MEMSNLTKFFCGFKWCLALHNWSSNVCQLLSDHNMAALWVLLQCTMEGPIISSPTLFSWEKATPLYMGGLLLLLNAKILDSRLCQVMHYCYYLMMLLPKSGRYILCLYLIQYMFFSMCCWIWSIYIKQQMTIPFTQLSFWIRASVECNFIHIMFYHS